MLLAGKIVRLVIRIRRRIAIRNDSNVIRRFLANGEDDGFAIPGLGEIETGLGKAGVRDRTHSGTGKARKPIGIRQERNHRAVRVACKVFYARLNGCIGDIRCIRNSEHRSVFCAFGRIGDIEIDILEAAQVHHTVAQGIDVQGIGVHARARSGRAVKAGARYVGTFQVDVIVAQGAVFGIAAVNSAGDFAAQEVQRVAIDGTVGITGAVGAVDAACDGTAVYGNGIVGRRIALGAVDRAINGAAVYGNFVKIGRPRTAVTQNIACDGRAVCTDCADTDLVAGTTVAAIAAIDGAGIGAALDGNHVIGGTGQVAGLIISVGRSGAACGNFYGIACHRCHVAGITGAGISRIGTTAGAGITGARAAVVRFRADGQGNRMVVCRLRQIKPGLGKACICQGAKGDAIKPNNTVTVRQKGNDLIRRKSIDIFHASTDGAAGHIGLPRNSQHGSIGRRGSRGRNIEIEILEGAQIHHTVAQGIDVQGVVSSAGGADTAIEAGVSECAAVEVDCVAVGLALCGVTAVNITGDGTTFDGDSIIFSDAAAVAAVDPLIDGAAIYGQRILRSQAPPAAIDGTFHLAAVNGKAIGIGPPGRAIGPIKRAANRRTDSAALGAQGNRTAGAASSIAAVHIPFYRTPVNFYTVAADIPLFRIAAVNRAANGNIAGIACIRAYIDVVIICGTALGIAAIDVSLYGAVMDGYRAVGRYIRVIGAVQVFRDGTII